MRYAYDNRRGSRHERGYDSKWVKASKAFLAAHQWCRMCEAEGKRIPATEVDHIERHGGDKRLFWRRSNWQGLCKPHHSAKTRAEMSGKPVRIKGADARGFPLDPAHPWNEGGGLPR